MSAKVLQIPLPVSAFMQTMSFRSGDGISQSIAFNVIPMTDATQTKKTTWLNRFVLFSLMGCSGWGSAVPGFGCIVAVSESAVTSANSQSAMLARDRIPLVIAHGPRHSGRVLYECRSAPAARAGLELLSGGAHLVGSCLMGWNSAPPPPAV